MDRSDQKEEKIQDNPESNPKPKRFSFFRKGKKQAEPESDKTEAETSKTSDEQEPEPETETEKVQENTGKEPEDHPEVSDTIELSFENLSRVEESLPELPVTEKNDQEVVADLVSEIISGQETEPEPDFNPSEIPLPRMIQNPGYEEFASIEKEAEPEPEGAIKLTPELTALQRELLERNRQEKIQRKIRQEEIEKEAKAFLSSVDQKDREREELAKQYQVPPIPGLTPEEEALFNDFEKVEKKDDAAEAIDPDSTFVDEEDYSLYEDKRRFWLYDYRKVEEYLEMQAKQGFLYEKHEGKKYYFHKVKPKNHYYQMLYFKNEPTQQQWDEWEAQGWRMAGQELGKKKRDAGWYIVYNTEKPGEYRKSIDNEAEKFKMYKKCANSYRSTMFLLFITMVLCAVTLYLQIMFKGFLFGMLICEVLFCVALLFFIFYGNLLRKSKKQIRLLKARMRLKKNGQDPQLTGEEA